MKKITLLIALMISSLGFAQQVLIQDFETAPPTDYTIAGFEGLGSATRVADPAAGGTRGTVFQLVSVSTGNPWQGAEVLLSTSKIKLTTDKTAKVDVYSTQAFTLFAKVESGTGPASAASENYTTPGAWQTLTFTFTESLDGTGVANGEYAKIAFFPGWKADNSGWNPASNSTIYVDNIIAEKTVVAPDAAPTTAAPMPPNRDPADVKAIYSNKYAQVSVDTYNTSWCGANTTEVMIVGDATNKVTGLGSGLATGCEGIEFITGRFDATAFTHLHMDIWTETATLDKVFNVKFSNWDNRPTGPENNAIEFNINNSNYLPNPNPGTWISMDIPVPAGLKNDFVQFVITSSLGIVYYDNIYLYKGTALGTAKFETSSVKMYPNPVKNTLTIEANASINKVSVYNVLGQEVMTASPKSNSIILQTNELQRGVYMVTTEIDGKISTSKVVKE